MTTVDEVLERLREKARPEQVQGMARYGMMAEKRMGGLRPHCLPGLV